MWDKENYDLVSCDHKLGKSYEPTSSPSHIAIAHHHDDDHHHHYHYDHVIATTDVAHLYHASNHSPNVNALEMQSQQVATWTGW